MNETGKKILLVFLVIVLVGTLLKRSGKICNKPSMDIRFNNGETLICNRYIFSPASKNINNIEWEYDKKKKIFYNKITGNYFDIEDCNEFK